MIDANGDVVYQSFEDVEKYLEGFKEACGGTRRDGCCYPRFALAHQEM